MIAVALLAAMIVSQQAGDIYEAEGTLVVVQIGEFWNAYLDVDVGDGKIEAYRLDLPKEGDYKELHAKIDGKPQKASVIGQYRMDGFRRVLDVPNASHVRIKPAG